MKNLGKLKKVAPIVSVVMSAYNAERFIGQAIQSIMDQTWKDFEFIIVDDCSRDNTPKLINEYARIDKRIKSFKNKVNLGGCLSLDRGMKMAKGKYLAVMDNDDWSYPDRLMKQVDFLEKHPDVGIVGGTMEIMDEHGIASAKRQYHQSDADIRKNIFRYSPFSHPLIMIRRSVLETVGYANCEFAPADDYEMYFRIGTISKFANLNDTILKYRIVSNSLTQRCARKMILNSIKTRNTYRKTTGYRMHLSDRIFDFFLRIFAFFLPTKIIIKAFNLIRNIKEL